MEPSTPPAADPLEVELAELRKALEKLLDIVINVYITSWYTSISPRDRTFVHAVRNTALGLVDSIIHDLTVTQQTRDDAVSRMRQLALETGPTILECHIKAIKQAHEDCLIDVQVEALNGSGENIDVNRPSTRPSRNILAQRYHYLAPHPGIAASANNPSQAQKPSTADTEPAHPADTEHLKRPVTPQGIDESLADALSSSITGVPGRAVSRDPPVSNYRSEEHPRRVNALPYEPSPEYFAALVDRILRGYLPPKDYTSTTERAMITEIIANTILGNILRKCSEPWFLWRIGLSLMEAAEEGDTIKKEARSEKDNGVTRALVTKDDTVARGTQSSARDRNIFGLTPFYASILSQLPSVIAKASWRWLRIASGWLQQYFFPEPNPPATSLASPVHPLCSPSKHILEPWLEVMMALTSAGSSYGKQELWSLSKIAYTLSSNTADRFAEQVVDKALHIDTATRIIAKLTDILFPEGRPAATVPDPSPEEAEEMRLLGIDEAAQMRTITDAFETFSNPSANTTVLLTLVESAIFALLPKMTEQG
ncbi:hypothetical protein QFC22_000752 [Naganishia vaughanmartiniae]|uniref:Uncharacterized protein n=1 Tax=Naganishia vaughanmartiniae TaxID=1424756 RepID=A0ACC2XKR7_9TREE|nr:hypothetical protein QFC22_000752 [Naganishia vaughanmartiniae]